MLTLSKLSAHGSAAGVSEYLRSEYYQAEPGAEGRSVNRWTGALAEKLGLSGEVRSGELENLLAGFSPDGSRKLVKSAGKEKHRMGEDLTFSADKTVSLAFAIASPEEQQRLIHDTQEAARVAIEYLQTQIKGYNGKQVDGMAVAQFQHFSNRNGEVDLHTHCVVLNLVDAGGKVGGFDPYEIYQQKMTAGALYRAELAHRLHERGYAIRQEVEKNANGYETGNIFYKVAGIDRDTELAFSSRRQQIVATADANGWTMAAATLATRHGKEADFQQTIQNTRDTLQGMGHPLKTQDLHGQSQLPETADEQILRRCHSRESAFTMADAIREVAQARGGMLDAKACIADAAELVERQHCIKLDRGRFASEDQASIEAGIRNSAVSRKDDKSVRLSSEQVAKAIADTEKSKGFSFTDEQKRGVEFVASGSGGTACLVGYAGTGKTTTATAYIHAFKDAGRKVIGCSTAWKAAKKLEQETGMESYSIASIKQRLSKGKLKLDKNTVLVVDEAGMVGARNIRHLQQAIDKAGGKMVLLGDPQQLQPIEAGAGFVLAMDAGKAIQTDIRRQKDPEHRKISQSFYGKADGRKLVAMMEKTQAFQLSEKQEQARQKLVGDYLADPEQDKHIYAATRAEVSALNNAIRNGLKANGRLNAKTENIITAQGEKLDETKPLGLCAGDAIRFTDRNDEYGYVNGTMAKVIGFKNGTMAVELDDKKQLAIHTDKPLPIAYDYATTVHKAQGQTFKHAYWLTNGDTTREMGLVAYTRHSERMGIYTTREGKRELVESLNDWQGKRNIRDYPRQGLDTVKQRLADAWHGMEQKLTRGRSITDLLEVATGKRRGYGLEI